MFPQEAQHRTDQLILSSRRGRTALYTGKLLAGLTVGVGFGLLLLATLLGVTGLVYGLEGFGVLRALYPADALGSIHRAGDADFVRRLFGPRRRSPAWPRWCSPK